MKKIHLMTAIVLFFGVYASAAVIDAPHNETNDIRCTTCHTYALWWQYSPSTQHSAPDHSSIADSVCLSCHDTGGSAPLAKTHSAAVMGSTTYHGGTWAIGCTECHDPHYQGQLSWMGTSPSPYLITGTIDSVSVNTPQDGQSTIVYSGATSDAEWPAQGAEVDDLDWARKNQSGRGLIFVHDTSLATNTFSIISATDNQVVVSGILDPDSVDPSIDGNPASSNSFALIYGQLIRSQIVTPASGSKDVKFFRPLGGFVNAENPVSGVCQVCHTEAVHFRNTGDVNVGEVGFDHTAQAALNCIACHAHSGGFAHGPGGVGSGCGTTTECHGTKGSHPPHLNPAGLVKATCAVCHDTSQFPTFADGQKTIPATTVCTLCHDNGKGVFVVPPEWGAISPPQCTECHAASPSTGSHSKHLSTSGIACANCHKGAVQGLTGSDQHLDGNIDVYNTTPGDLGYPVDKTINSAEATCSVAACHGSGTPQWGGSVTCYTCHVGASDVDDYTYGNSVLASINEAQWLSSGHGLAAGTYEVSGNPAANLGAAAGSGNACTYCHDPAINHGAESNPFRLANNNVLGNGANDTCLICHGTAGSGYDPDGADAMTSKTATIKIDKNHHGQKHGAGNDGGSLCWDCHDPHGDRVGASGNIFMIQTAVVKDKADAYGRPTATAEPVFTANTMASDYAKTEAPFTGICQVCHADTKYYKNDSGANGHFTDSPCVNCHLHGTGVVNQYAFNHGGGSGDVATCQECHGHDAGYGGATGGKGTFATHSTHTENDADDLRGPNIGCNSCHNTSSMPDFSDGVSYSAYKSGTPTTVCNNCHSPGGTYNGVNDLVVGAKANWQNGVYEANGSLKAGKEKWCATCHDENASIISGITAPNVIGDEDGAYTYGVGWGYYKTGHGLTAGANFPSKGGVETLAGRQLNCDACHDYTTAHIDGDARSFGCGDGCNATEYRQGYRLKLVDGQEPMVVPWPGNTSIDNGAVKYRLCVSCHDAGPFAEAGNMNTNLVKGGTNYHKYHLDIKEVQYPADYNYGGSGNSQMTCVVCHNVHGSTRLAMVRDGKLINREPGLMMWYSKTGITQTYTFADPEPQDLPLSLSDGVYWRGFTASNLCSNCHGGNYTYTRAPYQAVAQAPSLSWTNESSYLSDGADPDSASAGSQFIFRVLYSDANDIPPSGIELWVDENDNGIYEVGEKYPMSKADEGDTLYYNGVIYTRSLTVAAVGDNVIKYRFYASDGTLDAIGSATGDSSITIIPAAGNNAPVLTWVSGDCRDQGVTPSVSLSGAVFNFYVSYADADNEFNSLQVWVDLNDDGDYDDVDEKQDMAIDGGDGDFTNGENFTKNLTLNHAGDGKLNYRFVASDGTDAAIGTPTLNQTVSIVEASGTIRTVCPAGHPNAPCWSTTIQPAVAGSASGDTVLVYDGTYNEKVSFNLNYNNIKVRSVCGPEHTTIDAAGVGNGVYHYWASGSVVDGFQIINGSPGVSVNKYGNLTIENCLIHDNPGGGVTGGWDATATAEAVIIKNSQIYNNQSASGAGIALSQGGGSSLTNSIVRNNTATGNGGGVVMNNDAGFTVVNSIVADNTTQASGGAFWVDGALTLTNSTIANNRADGVSGGGAFYTNTFVTINAKNSIIWNNYAPIAGQRHIAYLSGTTTWTVVDSILSNDGDTDFGDYPYIFSNSATMSFSGFVSGSDPQFVDAAHGDYHLKSISPAINKANEAFAPADDIDGDSRPQGLADDIGADEYNSTIVNSEPVLSWTGESGYTADGVDPDNGVGSGNFVFRVDYTDADNHDPVLLQVWVDSNDDGAYSAEEKHDLTATDGADIIYTDGKRYSTTLALPLAGDGNINYRFYATDGRNEAAGGDPVINHVVTVTNNAPTLSWTGEANFTTDGVHPDSAVGGTGFEFRIDYTDIENTAPALIQVWVDVNDNGSFESGEKYDMSATDGGDTNYSDGKRYTKTLPLLYRGDGSLNYRFAASDGTDQSTDAPTVTKIVTVVNNPPVLSWTGEAGFDSGGVSPGSGPDGSSFEFRIDYTDIDNTAPASMQVWVDANDNGAYEPGEKYEMNAVDGGDTTYSDGKRFTKTLTLAYTNDGVYNYRFSASDSTDSATGAPAADRTVTITFSTNTAPTLSWTGETDTSVYPNAVFITDGVHPDSGAGGNSFAFRIKYTDTDDEAPTVIQVWIDADDSGSYEPGEKHDLTQVDAGDTVFTDGKLYAGSFGVPFVADGTVSYRFYASDGIASATGQPVTAGGSIAVVDPLQVPGEFASIGLAISSAANGDIILVASGAYNENINFGGKNITIQSVSGAGSTTIGGNGSNNPVVIFSGGENSAVLDGFTIDNVNNGTYYNMNGIKISNASKPVIRNSIITGNSMRGKGTGILIDGGAATIENCTINGNSNNYEPGAGLYLINGSATTTITDSSISSNTSTYEGAGMYVDNSAIVLTDVIVDSNSNSQRSGGGAYFNGNVTATISGGSISNNTSKFSGAGLYFAGSGASSLSIDGTTINSNRNNVSSTSNGGGLYLANIGTTTTINNATINSNICYNSGGGIYATNAALSISGSTINSNTGVNNDAGGIYLAGSAASSISNTAVNSNTCRNTAGGILLSGTNVTLTNVTIDTNRSTTSIVGGLYVSGGTVSMTGSSVSGNQSATDVGGVQITTAGTVFAAEKSNFRGNRSGGNTSVGALDLAASTTTTLTNCNITGNITGTNYFSSGGGIRSAGTLNLKHSTVAGNWANRKGGGILVTGGAATIDGCLLWDNLATDANSRDIKVDAGSATVTYSAIKNGGGYGGSNNISAITGQVFVSPDYATSGNPKTGGDYHLRADAMEAIDSANPASEVVHDIDGNNTRPTDGPGVGGAVNDMGMDEYVP